MLLPGPPCAFSSSPSFHCPSHPRPGAPFPFPFASSCNVDGAVGQSRRSLAGGGRSDFLHRGRGPGRHFWLRREPMKRSRGGRRGGLLGCWACWASKAGMMAVGAFWGSMDYRISKAVSGRWWPSPHPHSSSRRECSGEGHANGGGRRRGRRSGVESGGCVVLCCSGSCPGRKT